MKMTSKSAFIEHFPLFDVLTETEKVRLSEMVDYKERPKYSYIYFAGDVSDTIFFLVKGAIKIGIHSDDGKEVIKAVLHPTKMFGELCVVGEDRRPDFAMAMNEDVAYYTLKAEDFRDLMQSNITLCTKILDLMGERLRRTESRLEALVFKDARTRIIDFLKESASNRGMRIGLDEMLVKHTLTQQDIANITGTSRQTVTSVLNELKKSNLIHFNRRSILIRNMAALA